jgi:hypothetical protein
MAPGGGQTGRGGTARPIVVVIIASALGSGLQAEFVRSGGAPALWPRGRPARSVGWEEDGEAAEGWVELSALVGSRCKAP